MSSKSKEGKAAHATAPSKAVSIIPSSEGPSSKVVEDVCSSRQGAAVADQVRWKGVVYASLVPVVVCGCGLHPFWASVPAAS